MTNQQKKNNWRLFHIVLILQFIFILGKVKFASLQSEYAREVMEKFHVPPDLDSLVAIEDECLYTHSSGTRDTTLTPEDRVTVGGW